VLKAYTRTVLAATCICVCGFIICQIFPVRLVGLFAPNGSSALLHFAPITMRITTSMMPFIGFQIVSANMFVVTGRPKISIFLSMIRQLIILIPCLIIFGRVFGLWGVVASQPTADCVSVIITGFMIARELKQLKRQSAAELQK
jgi:Na+-driven multidrug efflux pump